MSTVWWVRRLCPLRSNGACATSSCCENALKLLARHGLSTFMPGVRAPVFDIIDQGRVGQVTLRLLLSLTLTVELGGYEIWLIITDTGVHFDIVKLYMA
jgi:hypothetical protein